MSENCSSRGSRHEFGTYEIRLTGHLENRWAAWFDGLSLTHESDGTTVLRGPVVDQAALHGLLQRVRDLGLPLVSVAQVEPDPPGPADLPDLPDLPDSASMTHQTMKGSTP